jgi:hypothetical protein
VQGKVKFKGFHYNVVGGSVFLCRDASTLAKQDA